MAAEGAESRLDAGLLAGASQTPMNQTRSLIPHTGTGPVGSWRGGGPETHEAPLTLGIVRSEINGDSGFSAGNYRCQMASKFLRTDMDSF